MNNYYTKTETDSKITDDKIKYNSFFVTSGNKVGDVGMITDGVYNVKWVIYTISGNTYQLFPMQNLTTHQMNSNASIKGGYEGSDMYIFVHNTVLPNLRRSGLNITACDLVGSKYYDIANKTGISDYNIAGGEEFWVTIDADNQFYYVNNEGSFNHNGFVANANLGVRPLITVVK